jgi:hypothetical protein
VALGDPARRDPVVLGHLVLHANAQVAVTEDELVEAERPPDPVAARVVARVDVIAEVSAVDTDGSGWVAARADALERLAGEPGRVASRHRPPPFRDLPRPPSEPPSRRQPSTRARVGSRRAARWSARPGLAYERHELVAALYDPLGFDPEALEALQPAAEEALEAVAPAMRAALGAGSRLMPLDLRVEQVEDDREVTAVESGVPALECLDVRIAHEDAVHHAGVRGSCCGRESRARCGWTGRQSAQLGDLVRHGVEADAGQLVAAIDRAGRERFCELFLDRLAPLVSEPADHHRGTGRPLVCSSLATLNTPGAPGSGGAMWPRRTSNIPPIAAHGLRSGAPHTASARRPPGRGTRRISESGSRKPACPSPPLSHSLSQESPTRPYF